MRLNKFFIIEANLGEKTKNPLAQHALLSALHAFVFDAMVRHLHGLALVCVLSMATDQGLSNYMHEVRT